MFSKNGYLLINHCTCIETKFLLLFTLYFLLCIYKTCFLVILTYYFYRVYCLLVWFFHKQMFQSVTNSTIGITQESCSYLSQSSIGNLPTIKVVNMRLSSLVDSVSHRILQTHHIWFNTGNLINEQLFESLRYSILELQEHLDTFCDKRDQATMVSAISVLCEVIALGCCFFHSILILLRLRWNWSYWAGNRAMQGTKITSWIWARRCTSYIFSIYCLSKQPTRWPPT